MLSTGLLAGIVLNQCGNPAVSPAVSGLLPDGAPGVVIASQDGAWSDPATWGGIAPGQGDDVRIPDGVTVTYDVDDVAGVETRFHFVRVDGVLTWATDRSTTMFVDTLFNTSAGEILIGDPSAPVPVGLTADVVIIADTPLTDPQQLSRGLVLHGRNRIVGADVTDYGALVGDAPAGATSFALRDAPSGWNAGDTLVLGGTFFDPAGSNADDSRFHDEVLTITSVRGSVVSFAPALQWDHERPSGTHFTADDLTLYVGHLTRNITFRSELDPASPDAPTGAEPQDRRRGHLMVMHTPDSVVEHAAFVDFGRLNKDAFIDDPLANVDGTPATGTNVRGRYAFHHHRNLPQGNQPIDQATCVPALVRGCVVWGSPGWGFVHHDSHCVFEDNVAFDVVGSAFVQEAGNEIGAWRRNLSIKTTGDADPELTVEPFGDGYKRVTNFDFGFNGEAYWIQGASQVACTDNIAISAAGGGANIFSDVDGNANRDRGFVPVEHLPAAIQHIVTNDSGLIAGNRVPANTFTGFVVINSDFGLLTWNHMRNQGSWIGFTCPCDGNFHREYAVIDDFTFWNIYGQGIHLQYSSQIELRDGLIASSDLATPGVDDKPVVDLAINGNGRGYGLGMNGPTKRLVVENVIIEGWEFGLRTPKEGSINGLDQGEGTGSEGALGLADRRSVFVDLRMANNGDHLYRRQDGFSETQAFANYLVIEGGDFANDVPNDPPIADFAVVSHGPYGVVELLGTPAVDLDTPGGPSPFDPKIGWVTNYSVVRNDPNDIVAYAWDLDADGVMDAFGETVVTQFPLGQATPVTLTVWDHQGATHTTTRDVTPVAVPYAELIVDGAFSTRAFNDGSINSGSTDSGWFSAWGFLADGAAEITGQFNFGWVAQAVYDDRLRRGPQRFTFDYELYEGHANPNNGQVSRLHARVWGIDTEFDAVYTDEPRAAGAVPYDAVLLYDEWFETPTDGATVSRVIDAGTEGFAYYMVAFRGTGVSIDVPGDLARIDNVSIIGASCPSDVNGDDFVDFADLLALLACWNSSSGDCTSADLDADGVVAFNDLLQLLADWGPC